MKVLRVLLLFLCVFLYVGCDNDEAFTDNSPVDSKLKGTWVNGVFEEPYWKFEKSNALKENELGFSFNPEQKFIERGTTGGCGTPPLVTKDYNGLWTLNDSIIKITVGYWGGIANYEWKIKSIDDKYLFMEIVDVKFVE